MEGERKVWRGRGTCRRGEEHAEGERNMWRGEECVEEERNVQRVRGICGGSGTSGLATSIIGCGAARAFMVLRSLHLSKGLRSSRRHTQEIPVQRSYKYGLVDNHHQYKVEPSLATTNDVSFIAF